MAFTTALERILTTPLPLSVLFSLYLFAFHHLMYTLATQRLFRSHQESCDHLHLFVLTNYLAALPQAVGFFWSSIGSVN
jgi:hypothetical protein